MSRNWNQFIGLPEWQALFEEGPINEMVEQIDRQLLDPRTDWQKTTELRAQRLGIMAVRFYAEDLATREARPADAEVEQEEKQDAVERILGHRPLWSPRRRPEPNKPTRVARYTRRGA